MVSSAVEICRFFMYLSVENHTVIKTVCKHSGKRQNYVQVQLTHHVPCEEGEVCRVRTGFETAIAHRVSDTFAVAAKADGVVISIDEVNKITKVQYADEEVITSGHLKTPYPTSELNDRFTHHKSIGILTTIDEVLTYHVDQTFDLTPKLNAVVVSLKHITSVSEIDDAILIKDAHKLIDYLNNHVVKELLYVELHLIGKTKPGVIEAISFADQYTKVSGSMVKQVNVLNVKLHEHVKRGDILTYNSGFFVPDLKTKQVHWKHGVVVNVALIEMSSTLEDGCAITENLSQKMTMHPAHAKTITMDADTYIHQIVSLGDHVETTDILCVFEEGALHAMTSDSQASNMMFLSELNRKTPRAKYHGEIVDISIYYACDFNDLNSSLQKLVKLHDKRHKALSQSLQGTNRENTHFAPGQVNVGLKYSGVEFQKGTVLIEFIISESIKAEQGDKLVIMNANKTIISHVLEKAPKTQSGTDIDVIFSTTSLFNRIVTSPFKVGIANRVLEALEHNILDIWNQ